MRALGAQAVAVGRAALWGACAGGEAGARRALSILIDELRLAMKLAGTADLASASQLELQRTHTPVPPYAKSALY